MQPSALSRMFDRGASRYDLLVGLNPGYHAELRRAAGALAGRIGPSGAPKVIDLACGSGASTRALLAALPGQPSVVGLDASAGMLAQAIRKSWPDGVRFAEAVAGALDVADLEPGSWDGVFTAYLFRNVPEAGRDRALAEVYELLAPGGWVVVQDYSVAGDRWATLRWHLVSWLVIIPLGLVADRNPGLYRYLWRSVLDFDDRQRFGDRLEAAGFAEVAHRTASGWQRGILHTFVARKPG
ncbi:MAG TPA: class I SAM-dependent methyltransferase [Propionicimonas sp.]|nr:class I SAM-dependent methyltransferase [Propionicimonas sp.]